MVNVDHEQFQFYISALCLLLYSGGQHQAKEVFYYVEWNFLLHVGYVCVDLFSQCVCMFLSPFSCQRLPS